MNPGLEIGFDDLVLDERALEPAGSVTPGSLPSAVVLPRGRGLEDALSDDEMTVVDAAFERGVGVLEVAALIARVRGVEHDLRTTPLDAVLHSAVDALNDPEPESEFSQRGLPNLVPLLEEVFARERVYVEKLVAEYGQLADHMQQTFVDVASLNGVKSGSGVDSYRFVRERLLRAGWPPIAIFSEIVAPEDATLLGHRIGRGAHGLLVELLEEHDLAGVRPSREIISVLGFQPRRIAGSERLSNHVWGLALDIDAPWNPMIKNDFVNEILLRHTGMDFSKPIVKPNSPVKELYAQLKGASDRLVAWLGDAIPVERNLLAAEAAAKARLKAAELGLALAKTTQEKQLAEAELEAAKAAVANAHEHVLASTEVFELGELRKYFGDDVDGWQERGILTVPLWLVLRLKDAGFIWGGEYEGSKDLMHFELDPELVLAGLRKSTVGE